MMSNRPFRKGFALRVRGTRAQRYKPGAKESNKQLVERVVGSYLDNTLARVFQAADASDDDLPLAGKFEECTRYLREMLEPELSEDFDHDSFLDEVLLLTRLNPKNPPGTYYQDLDGFISPLVQALYDLGRNNFVLDMSCQELDTTNIASYLHGTRGNPLTLTYSGKICRDFGFGAEHCNLSITGFANWVGMFAQHSTLVSHIAPEGERTPDYGKESDWCDFHIYHREFSITGFPGNANFYLHFPPEKNPVAQWGVDLLAKMNTSFHLEIAENVWKGLEPKSS